MNCPGCNTPLTARVKFCPECGFRMAPPPGIQPAPPTHRVQGSGPAMHPPSAESVPKARATEIRVFSSDAERRQVTVLFSDLKGFTTFSETNDPETVREIVSEIFSRFAQEITGRGGAIDKYIGDAVMALFGAPESHEDDPVRALGAALAMQETLRQFNAERGTKLEMRIGVNTGDVVWGSTVEGGAATVMGDAVNVAQRLESAARPGEILVGLTTQRLAEEFFILTALPALSVKGKNLPVQPYRLVSQRRIDPTYRIVSGLHAPLVGRERELAVFRDVFQACLTRSYEPRRNEPVEPGIVLLHGEAGTGKSRLIFEFERGMQEAAQPPRVLKGRCIAYASPPYAPVREILRKYYGLAESPDPEKRFEEGILESLRRLERYSDVDRRNFAHLIGIMIAGLQYPDAAVRGLDPKSAREVLLEGFRAWVEGMSREAPLVLVLDDMHWADASSIDLVASLIQVLPRGRWMVVVSSRDAFLPGVKAAEPAPDGRSPVVRIEIGPLGEAQTIALAEAAMKGRLDDDLKRLLWRQSGGNPYYAEELLRFLLERVLVERFETDGRPVWRLKREGTEMDKVPETLQGLLGARIDSLRPEERDVLTVAAVIGRSFWGRMLGEVSGRAVDRELEALRQRELIFGRNESDLPGDTEYIFKTALLREAGYGRLTRKQRQHLHAVVAAWIETHLTGWGKTSFVALAAHHREMSGENARALELWSMAAQEARRALLMADMELYASRAIGILEKLEADDPLAKAAMPRMVEFLELRAEACEFNARGREAMADLERALRICGSAPAEPQARLLRKMGGIAREFGPIEDAQRYYEQSVDIGRMLVPPSRALAESLLDWAFLVGEIQCQFDRAEAMTRKALTIVNTLQDHELIAKGERNLGVIEFRRGRLKEALERFGKVLEHVDSGLSGDAAGVAAQRARGRAWANIGAVHYARGDVERALHFLERSLATAEEIGDRVGVGKALGNMGLAWHNRGDFDRALDCHRRHRMASEDIGDRRGAGSASLNMGLVYHERGDLDRALECYQQNLWIAEEVGDKRSMALALGNIGNLFKDRGDLEGALAFLQKSLSLCEAIGDRIGVTRGTNNVGGIHYELGERAFREGKVEDAGRYWERSIELQNRSLSVAEQVGTAEGIAQAHAGLGDALCAWSAAGGDGAEERRKRGLASYEKAIAGYTGCDMSREAARIREKTRRWEPGQAVPPANP